MARIQVCEKCHEREATSATMLPAGSGSNPVLTQLCSVCLEAEQAKAPQSLHDLIGQLEGKPHRETVLIYQLKRENYRPTITGLSADDFWLALEEGGWKPRTIEGRITHMSTGQQTTEGDFELDEGTTKSRWQLHGERSAYSVGRWARIEYIVFGPSGPAAGLPVVTRIWIEQ
jgi:hypothetical protein